MEIKGKRGSQTNNKGFQLISPHWNGRYYIRVWFKDTYRKKDDHTVVDWKSLGNWELPKTKDLLFEHLIEQYGSVNEQEVLRNLQEDFEIMERKRELKEKEKYDSILLKIQMLLSNEEYQNLSIPDDLKNLQKLYKKVIK